LFCCALGGAILLVVMFSTRLRLGFAIEPKSFLIIEYRFTQDEPTRADLRLMGLAPTVTAAGRDDVEPRAYREISRPDRDAAGRYFYRWVAVGVDGERRRSDRDDTRVGAAYLILTGVNEPLDVMFDRPAWRGPVEIKSYLDGETRSWTDNGQVTVGNP
jgi:hypothetical protein